MINRPRPGRSGQTPGPWGHALDEFEGANAVILLTAHRSKGLEYHTVFFLGIHAKQWWAYGSDRREGTSTFFVGLSRAAHRLIFTTDRTDRTGPIGDLFTMLAEAGVPEAVHPLTRIPATEAASTRSSADTGRQINRATSL